MTRAGGAWLVAGAALLVAGLLGGCASTQEKNARAELRAKRELASRELPRDVRPDARVRVEHIAFVRGEQAGSGAIVVDLRSRAARPLTDVPIAVGVRGADGRRRLVNARRHLGWFQTHVAAIPARGRVTWVFKGARGIGAGDRPFAKVGVVRGPTLSRASSLPRIDAAAEPVARAAAPARKKRGKGAARPAIAHVVVENSSAVPQYDLQVQAFARRGGRYLAAGKAELEHLGTGQRATVAVPLAGSARQRQLRVEAIPTIFE